MRTGAEIKKAVLDSGLFDAPWYLERNPEVEFLGMDPLDHFLSIGLRMMKDPGPRFATHECLERNPHLKASGLHPILSLLGDNSHPTAGDPRFSVIMPTKNRENSIGLAIDSLMHQTYKEFELIIVDDGSSDGTDKRIRRDYGSELKSGKIRYIFYETSQGVCSARNIGLSHASCDWITYLDSDNTVRPNFLSDLADAIRGNTENRTFYGQFYVREKKQIEGRPFDLASLQERNFIDIGVFAHHRLCFKELGGFDNQLRRLVDWDLILRYTTRYPPVYIPSVLMDYSNAESSARISRGEAFSRAAVQIHRKHGIKPTVTVALLTYNQEAFIDEALQSALRQTGDFTIEILASDDGSTDRTPEILADYAKKHSSRVRLIGSRFNHGISENFKRCFLNAAGEYIAVLEGDDYWCDDKALAQRVEFMLQNPDCSMVFNKMHLMSRGHDHAPEFRELDRQNKLQTNRLNGQHFINDPDMNLIVNFSSCLFKTDLMKALPYQIYHYRLSEIALAFWLERHGPIGYLDKVLSVYRTHEGGTWSGADELGKIMSQIAVREVAAEVAAPEYADQIRDRLEKKHYKSLAQLKKAAA